MKKSTLLLLGIGLFALSSFTIWNKKLDVKGLVVDLSGKVTKKTTVAIAWDTDWGHGNSVQLDARQHKVKDTEAPAFNIRLDYPPDKAVIRRIGEAEIAVGYLIVFGDKNGNGFIDSNEEILGVDPYHCVTYVKGDLKAELGKLDNKTYTLFDLKQGFNLNRTIPPDDHRSSVKVDDLRPVKSPKLKIMVPMDSKKVQFPNCLWKI